VKIIRDSDDAIVEASVLTIGAFDGVHLGHQTVIREVMRRANERGVCSAVVTFDVHPATVVRPESAPKLLTTLDRKLELLQAIGVDATYVIEFNQTRANTTADEFTREVFVNRLNVAEIVVGADFHFGKGREGTVAFLEDRGAEYGFSVDGLELLRRDADATEHVSSTAIRRALVGGDIDGVTSMLGRHFEVLGEVVQGDQRGRSIGVPTANVHLPEDMARPANGVYAARYVTPDGVTHDAAVNIGVRPTFYEHADTAVMEAHLLDFDDDLYGQVARVQFVKFLRSERRFDGIEELKTQLHTDLQDARAALKGV